MTTPLARDLLTWYRTHARDLPWRRTRDPYHIWVSEIMLQQTRVETVLPYYHRWLERFPTVDALAAADTDAVLKAWEGLGYYSRARNLQRAARLVLADHGGQVPADPGRLADLPGIGPYTVGAIVSIAFGLPLPAVDGNVGRVLARLFARDDDPRDPAARRRYADLAAGLLPPAAAGDFNQALMELGALVCLPGRPRCTDCPVADHCRARATGRTLTLPARSLRRPARALAVAAAVVSDGDRLLWVRRPPGGLLGGLWALPTLEGAAPGGDAAAALAAELRRRYGLVAAVHEPLGSVEHVFTHLRWHLTAYACTVEPGCPRPTSGPDLAWLRGEEAAALALPAAFHKVLALLAAVPGWVGG